MSETPSPTTVPSTILVVTDADHVHDEVDAALGGDHTLVRVHAGAEVLAAVAAHVPALVVLDLQIGNMGGMATCMDLRLEERADRIPAQRIVMLLDRDVDAFLASLGSGLPGTYVLRLLGEGEQFEVCSRICRLKLVSLDPSR